MLEYYLQRGKVVPGTVYSETPFEDASIKRARNLLEEQEGWGPEKNPMHYRGPDNALVQFFPEKTKVQVNGHVDPDLLKELILRLEALYYSEMRIEGRKTGLVEHPIQDLLDELSGKS